jgi:hypothetical protein
MHDSFRVTRVAYSLKLWLMADVKQADNKTPSLIKKL